MNGCSVVFLVIIEPFVYINPDELHIVLLFENNSQDEPDIAVLVCKWIDFSRSDS